MSVTSLIHNIIIVEANCNWPKSFILFAFIFKSFLFRYYKRIHIIFLIAFYLKLPDNHIFKRNKYMFQFFYSKLGIIIISARDGNPERQPVPAGDRV